MQRNGWKKAFKRGINEIYEQTRHTGRYMTWRKLNAPKPAELDTVKQAAADSGIRIQYVSDIGQLQQALRMPDTGSQYIGIVHPADMLEPYATEYCQAYLAKHPDTDLLYTDEDSYTTEGESQIIYANPVLKPDFNLDMLRSRNYLGGLVLIRTQFLRQVLPSLHTPKEASGEYDLYLRCIEQTKAVRHLPRILYHRQGRPVQEAKHNEAILDAHYERMGIPATAEYDAVTGMYRTHYHWEETPLVSINIPNKDHIDDLSTCVESILKQTTYPNIEIVIIENNSTEQQTFDYYEKLQKRDARIRVITWKDAFNYAAITNFGVKHSKGEYILLMNNDVEVIEPDFIQEMLGFVQRSDVGICGARLLYFDDTIQHAGVIVGLGGICGEAFQGIPQEDGGYDNRIFTTQDYSAVTAACLMTKKSVFEAVGGMDEDLIVAYNDIDYCLRVRALGKLVVYNPYALLHHYEYKSRGLENTKAKLERYNREVDIFTARHGEMIEKGDPYYNRNLTRRYKDFSLRRVELFK